MLGNVHTTRVLKITPTWEEITANTTEELTTTVYGLKVGDFVSVNKPTHQAGLVVGGARVSALNTLAVVFGNLTGAGITPTASEAWSLKVERPELPLPTDAQM